MNALSRLLLPSLVLAAAALVGGAARADSELPPAGCYASLSDLGAVPVPANAPGLLFVDRSYGAVVSTTASLTSFDQPNATLGALAKDAAGYSYLPLDAPLVSGRSYDLGVAVDCTVPPASSLTTSFVAGEATALPATVGALALTYPDALENGERAITLQPSAALFAYRAQSIITVSENGVDQQQLVGPTDTALAFEVGVSDACRSPDGSGPLRAGSGTASIVVRAHVVGATVEPTPATLTITVDCTALAKEYPLVDPLPEGAQGGCAVGGGPSPVGWPSAAVGAFAVAALLRLRSRRARC